MLTDRRKPLATHGTGQGGGSTTLGACPHDTRSRWARCIVGRIVAGQGAGMPPVSDVPQDRASNPEDNLMPRTKPLSDREIHVLASAIGVIENQRLRSKIANDVWMTLREYDKALTDGPQSARWFALSRADQMVDF
jgi:hypothetical protein